MTSLELAIGPVQTFVAQARRTRDLWSGSWLLSYLAGQALHAIGRDHVVQPSLDEDSMIAWIEAERRGTAPLMGSLPNKMRARFDDADAAIAAAERATRAVHEAFEEIARAVYVEFVDDVAPLGRDTEAIWRRQIERFFEVVWVVGEQPGLLERRKSWRWRHHPPEPGDKCVLMGGLQEISGHRSRRDQSRFWEALRERVGRLDLRESERLCAVALVKRLLPSLERPIFEQRLDARSWPSTAWLAAVPWIRRAAGEAPEETSCYADCVGRLAGDVPGVADRLVTRRHLLSSLGRLDGNFFFGDALASDKLTPLADVAGTARRLILDQLEQLTRRLGGGPDPFVAVLRMDGDQLGRLLREGRVKPSSLSAALAGFARRVPDIVEAHDGVCPYCGGDDLLALLPLDRALDCAEALRLAYVRAFEEHAGGSCATISAGLALCHYRRPLRTALGTAGHLLEEFAKEINGRDSLAVAVLRSSGESARFVTTWTDAQGQSRLETVIRPLVIAMAEKQEPRLTASFVYRLRTLFTSLLGWSSWQPGLHDRVPDGLDLVAFVQAELVRSQPSDFEVDPAKIRRLAELTVAACTRHRRDQKTHLATGDSEVGIDALLLACFLGGRDGAES